MGLYENVSLFFSAQTLYYAAAHEAEDLDVGNPRL